MNLYQVEIEIFRGIPDEMVFVSAKDLSEAIKKRYAIGFSEMKRKSG